MRGKTGSRPVCSEEECENLSVARGLCNAHYKKWLYSDSEKLAKKQQLARDWYHNNSEKARANQKICRLKNRYDLTPEEYDLLLEKQGGICAICKKQKKLNVDHNHETGEVRGLLCHGCNTAVGYLENHSSEMWKYIGGER